MRQEWIAGWTVVACLAMAAGVIAQETAREPQDLEALARYLVKAKFQGYASGDESRIQHLADGGSEVRSEEDGYVYRDRWYGEDRFTGEEVVWHKGPGALEHELLRRHHSRPLRFRPSSPASSSTRPIRHHHQLHRPARPGPATAARCTDGRPLPAAAIRARQKPHRPTSRKMLYGVESSGQTEPR